MDRERANGEVRWAEDGEKRAIDQSEIASGFQSHVPDTPFGAIVEHVREFDGDIGELL